MDGMGDIYGGRLSTTVSLDLTPSPLLNRLNILGSQRTYSALSLITESMYRMGVRYSRGL